MGTWSLPQTPKQARKLKKLLKEPLRADEAADKLYDLLGDDELFDLIITEQKIFGDDLDVRDLVKFSLEEFLNTQENAMKPWDKEAVKICQSLVQTLY
jgi:predicted component of type VI protein secretion system